MISPATVAPARHGAGGRVRPARSVGHLSVLYDARCRLCRAARQWLARSDQLVPLQFVPAGSAEARRRFPGLDHAATLRDVTVISDTGQYWVGDGAWLACLWALRAYRGLSHLLASPRMLPLAGRIVSTAAGLRARQYRDGDDRAACTEQCHR